jgi:hypothetical protein
VNVGGASFLDILSRAFRRSNADLLEEFVVTLTVDAAAPDFEFIPLIPPPKLLLLTVVVLSLVPRMLANGRFMDPLAPIFLGWWYGFCSCC